MGCWNGTCAVSNLHITNGQKVAVFILLENKDKKSFCYNNAMYDLCPIPFYGEYNDYGAVEECHGFGLNIVVEALRARLYEFGQGPNSSHDCEVNQKNFDLDKLFEADHEDRLGIQDSDTWNGDDHDKRELLNMRELKGLTSSQQFELDRLCSKIKKEDTFRRATHVIIHDDILTAIKETWFIETYVGESKGNKGYDNNYIHIYFKDLIASIPEYIENIKAEIAKDEEFSPGDLMVKWLHAQKRTMGNHNSPNLATRWLSYFNRSSTEYALVDVQEYIEAYIENKDWDGLAAFVTEALTGAWVNSFMSDIRKAWSQQPGKGSQNIDPRGYRVLSKTVLGILKAEEEERRSWDEEYVDEAEDEVE